MRSVLGLMLPGIILIACNPHIPQPSRSFNQVACLIDPGAELTIQLIQQQTDWQPCSGNMMDAGFKPGAYWVRFAGYQSKQPDQLNQNLVLALIWNPLAHVHLYTLQEDRLIKSEQAGIRYQRDSWPMAVGNFPAFNLRPLTGSSYYLRVESDGIKRFPIGLYSAGDFHKRLHQEAMIIWIIFGIVISITLLALLFALGLREWIYLYYGLYVLALFFNLNSIYGNSYRIFWPDSPWLAQQSIFFLQGLATFFSIVFFRSITNLKVSSPRTDKIAYIIQILALILIPFTLLDLPRMIFSRIYTFTYIFLVPAFIIIMVRFLIQGKRPDLIAFAVGWGLYYSVGMIHLGYLLNLLPYTTFTVHGMAMMLPVETLVFGGGLAIRYQLIKKEREKLILDQQAALRKLESLHNPERYTYSRLGNLDVDALLLELNRLLIEENIYRDEELTLKGLADRLKINTHQLSELLNARLNVSFRQLLTNHRLKEAQALLTGAPEKSVLDIGLSVGFNSKTAFNVAFKKAYRISPTTYRKRST